VPFDVAGEHAQKDMSAHPRGEPVVDRPEVQIDGLQAAKGALDMGQVLVGADDTKTRSARSAKISRKSTPKPKGSGFEPKIMRQIIKIRRMDKEEHDAKKLSHMALS
jgi:GapR-like, DNA-binding domain